MTRVTSASNLPNADVVRQSGQFRDAERLYRRQLQLGELPESGRLESTLQLGACLMFQGHLLEALAYYGEVYVATRSHPQLHGYACRALRYHVNVLQRLHDGDLPAKRKANAEQQLTLIEEALRWLRSTGKESWRAGFLYHRADAERSLGKYERALDTAEDAYRSVRSGGGECAYRFTDHIAMVASCARHAGRFERGLNVLDEADSYNESWLDGVRVPLERVRIFRTMEPPRLTAAIEEARRAVRLVRDQQSDRERLYAHEELALVALAAGSDGEASNALRHLYKIARHNSTVDGRSLVRHATACFRQAKELLAGTDSDDAPGLSQRLDTWIDEFDSRLSSREPPG